MYLPAPLVKERSRSSSSLTRKTWTIWMRYLRFQKKWICVFPLIRIILPNIRARAFLLPSYYRTFYESREQGKKQPHPTIISQVSFKNNKIMWPTFKLWIFQLVIPECLNSQIISRVIDGLFNISRHLFWIFCHFLFMHGVSLKSRDI